MNSTPVIHLADRGEWPAALSASSWDVCIVGTGPAGATLAAELSGTDLRVIVLESGGPRVSAESDALNEIESVGRSRAPQSAVRARVVGGSSHTWGGRCAPFDAIDFEQRDWVPMSGWPLALDDLTPHLQRSAAHLGLATGTGFTDERFWELAGRARPAEPDSNTVLPFFWQFSRDAAESYPYEYMRFGRQLTDRLGPNVTLVTGATVLRVDPVESGAAVSSVHIAAPDGRRLNLRADAVALCAGGVENARILLASNTVTPAGLGNDHDQVGRYLMDHLRGPVGTFAVPESEGLQKRLGRYNVKGHLFRAGFRLSPTVQASEELLNCAAWLGETVAPDDPWDALRRVVGRGPRNPGDLSSLVKNSNLLVRGVKDYLVDHNGFPRKFATLQLDCMVEQRPDPDSRVTLSDRRDRFGAPLARVDWRSHPDEARTMYRMAALMAEHLPQIGLPPLDVADWVRLESGVPPEFVDVAHPTGTTRMSNDPSTGVVDRNGQVHGVAGLFVAGSSVFPTAGHCNPTQMIVALAIRLADHLKDRAATTAVVARTPAIQAPARVLVTGATGRIGRVVVEDLLDRGYTVRATTSKTPPTTGAGTGQVEWRQADFLLDPADAYDELVSGCQAVLHLGAEIGKMDRMPRVNVDATRFLAEAAERAGVSAFCYTSSVSVYGSGRRRVMTETSPVLTTDHDDRSQYWAMDYVRAYGRTKLAGEQALHDTASRVPYVIMRPTVVVDVHQILDIRSWSRVKRVLGAHRHAHHIYVRDVSDALIWAMERGLGGRLRPGSVETYNLSEDEFAEPTHAQFMKKAYAASGDRRFLVPKVPGAADWLHDFVRFRSFSLRNPLWRMRFPNDRLRAAGYRPRFGLAYAQGLALDEIRPNPDPAALGPQSGALEDRPVPADAASMLR